MIELEIYERNSMANLGKQTTRASKIWESKPSKQDLPIPKSLVGDEIQRRNNETRRGWARWKSYANDLLNGLTPWYKLPHIIMGIPSKEPE